MHVQGCNESCDHVSACVPNGSPFGITVLSLYFCKTGYCATVRSHNIVPVLSVGTRSARGGHCNKTGVSSLIGCPASSNIAR